MGGKRSTRVTKRDIGKAESLPALIDQLVKTMANGNAEDKEQSVNVLRNIANQNHGENTDTVFKAGAVRPLVKLLVSGSNNAQANACGALAAIAAKKPDHQAEIANAGSILPLVNLLKTGSAKVQEEVNELIREATSALGTKE